MWEVIITLARCMAYAAIAAATLFVVLAVLCLISMCL